jgi:ABC-type Na+ efflux pump permease subunit
LKAEAVSSATPEPAEPTTPAEPAGPVTPASVFFVFFAPFVFVFVFFFGPTVMKSSIIKEEKRRRLQCL